MTDPMLWLVFCGSLAGLRGIPKGPGKEELWRHLWALHVLLGCPPIGCMDLW